MKTEAKSDHNPHGGTGRGQGRRAKDGAKHLVPTSVSLTRDQLHFVQAQGGSKWIRGLIDKEQVRRTLEQRVEDSVESAAIKSSFSNFKLPVRLDCNPNFKSNPDDPF